MISKDMYKVIKRIPRFPKDTTSLKLLKGKKFEVDLLFDILLDALNCRYIVYTKSNNSSNHYTLEKSSFSLTEAGQLQIEEYKNKKSSSTKATWAIIISILSLIISAIAIILKI